MLNIPTKILSFIVFTITFPWLIQSQKFPSSYYNLCSPYKCGGITFPFPFSNEDTFGSAPIDCGLPGFQITCDDQQSSFEQVPKLMLSSRLYQVKNIFQNESDEGGGVNLNLITLVDSDLVRDFTAGSCQSLRNLTTSNNNSSRPSLSLPSWTTNLTFIRCPSPTQTPSRPSQEFLDQMASNYSCSEGDQLYLWRNDVSSQTSPDPPTFDSSLTPKECSVVMVPVSRTDMITLFRNLTNMSMVHGNNIEPILKALVAGFPLQWNSSSECEDCEKKNGRCGFDRTQVVCFCQGGDCNPTK